VHRQAESSAALGRGGQQDTYELLAAEELVHEELPCPDGARLVSHFDEPSHVASELASHELELKKEEFVNVCTHELPVQLSGR